MSSLWSDDERGHRWIPPRPPAAAAPPPPAEPPEPRVPIWLRATFPLQLVLACGAGAVAAVAIQVLR